MGRMVFQVKGYRLAKISASSRMLPKNIQKKGMVKARNMTT